MSCALLLAFLETPARFPACQFIGYSPELIEAYGSHCRLEREHVRTLGLLLP